MDFDAQYVFQQLFSSIQALVGHEANYQAALQYQLSLQTTGEVLREHSDQRTGRGGIDVVVRRTTGSALTMAFEIKGGAYGDRNALSDTFGPDGYCSDFDRLVALQSEETECWMVVIDALELGRGLSYSAQKGAIEQARERGIGFAYYAFGEETATILDSSGELFYQPIGTSENSGIEYSRVRPMMVDATLINEALLSDGRCYEKEADVVGRIYAKLRSNNASPLQISLETYFGFAPKTSMHQRPDLCIYEPPVNGQFNLYPSGNRSLNNDKVKLENLCCMVEVKGGLTLKSSRDQTLLKKYLSDIDKIRNWQEQIESARRQHRIGNRILDYIFIGVDHRKAPLSHSALEELRARSVEAGIQAHYVHQPVLK